MRKEEDRLISIFTRMNENKTNPLVINMKDLFLKKIPRTRKEKEI